MKKKKIILLNPPGNKLYIRDYYCSFSSKADYCWPPQDILYLSGILNKDFDVQVIDAIADRKTKEEIKNILFCSNTADIIFATGTATMNSDFRLTQGVKKKNKEIKLIASSGIMKFIGLEVMKRYSFLDAVLMDFTEPSIVAYVKGENKTELKGIIYRKKGHLVEWMPSMEKKFSLPIPRHDLFPLEKYRTPIAKRFPFAEVITSVGCPYNCAFCTAGAYGYKVRNVDNLIEELDYLSRLGIKEILFQDPTFTISTKRVIDICKKMLENNFKFTWSCNADIKSLNEEKIYYMKQVGCHTVSIGIESGSDEILEKYSKMITQDKIISTINLLNKYKIRILGYFIIGLPGEDKESIFKTINLAKQLDIDFASFSIATPDIGTRLREEALQEGWISQHLDIFDSTEFPTIETEKLKKEEIWKLRSKAVRKFYLRPSYIAKKIQQIKNFETLKIIVSNAVALLKKL